jgi:hypothetical protein
MSPTDPDVSKAPTRAVLAGDSPRTPEQPAEGTSAPAEGAAKRTLTMAPWPRRPVSLARVGPSRKAHARPFNDPSNYLG